MAVTPDEEEILTKGLDYLGRDISLGLTGQSDVPAGATGLPSPSAPGGMAGFAGGPGGIRAGGPSAGPPDISKYIDKLVKGSASQPQQEGGGGARISPEGFSLTGEESPGFTATPGEFSLGAGLLNDPTLFNLYTRGLLTGQPGGSDIAGSLAFDPGIRQSFLTGQEAASGLSPSDYSLGGPGGTLADPSLAASGGMGLAAMAAPVVNALINAAIKAALAQSGASPEVSAAIEGSNQVALSGVNPVGMLNVGTQLYSNLEAQKTLEQLQERAKSLSGQIGPQTQAWQTVPGLVAQLNQATTPEQAADIYNQIEAVQRSFQESGVEDFLQHGRTDIQGGEGLEGSMSAQFPQGPEIFKSLTPYMQAADIGRLRASDIAARGGQPIPGARGLMDYTMLSPSFTEALRPGAGVQQGPLAEFLGMSGTGAVNPLAGSREGMTALGAAGLDPGSKATPDILAFAGLPADFNATVGDIFNYLEAGGAGKGRADQFGRTDYGFTNLPLLQQLQAIQPGQYESGLAGLFGQHGGISPELAALGFGQPLGAASPLTAQINALVGGGGQGLAEGLLPEEERRRAGM